LRTNFKVWNLRYKDRYIKLKSEIDIEEKKEYEVEYDFGFEGGGDITKGFDPVEAKILMKEQIDAAGIKFNPDAGTFFADAEAKVESWCKKYELIPFTGLFLKGIKTFLSELKTVMRWRPETVFLIKVFALLRSAMEPDDPIQFYDATLQLPILLSRLTRSVNETETIKANRGITDPNRWTKKIYFKDTGILGIFEKGPLIVVANFLKSVKAQVRQRLVAEWQDRKDETDLTALEAAYSMMRRTKGYFKQTIYFIEEILPLLDTEKLDRTDQELFVKAVRVHVARRYQGVLKVFNVGGLMEASSVEGEMVSEQGRMTTELENELGVAKEVIKYRGLIPEADKSQDICLLLMLNKTIEKMNSNSGGNTFSMTYKNVVGAIAAQVRDEGSQLKTVLDEIKWPGILPEGQTLDSIGQDEDFLSFAKDFQIPRIEDFPFGLPPSVSGLVSGEGAAL